MSEKIDIAKNINNPRGTKSIHQIQSPLGIISMTLQEASSLVKTLRKMRGWTQVELAEKSDVSLRTIINLEQEKDVKLTTFFSLLEALDYQLDIKIIEK